MHDPWGGERLIDDDLLALLLEDQEKPSLQFSDIPFSQHNPTNRPPTSPTNMGRMKSIAQRKKNTTKPSTTQPGPWTETPLTTPQPVNTSPPNILTKAQPRDVL